MEEDLCVCEGESRGCQFYSTLRAPSFAYANGAVGISGYPYEFECGGVLAGQHDRALQDRGAVLPSDLLSF